MIPFGTPAAAVAIGQVFVAATVVIAVAWVISWFLPRRRPVARERLWLAALVGVLASPLVPISSRHAPANSPAVALLPAEQNVPPQVVATAFAGAEISSQLPDQSSASVAEQEPITDRPAVANPLNAAPDAESLPTVSPEAPARSGSRVQKSPAAIALPVIGLVWMSGVLLFVLRGFRGRWICRRILTRSRPIDVGRFSAELSQLRRALALRAAPRIVVSAEVGSPLVIGVLRPRIVLPEAGLEWMSSNQLLQILLHEGAHVVRRDGLVNVLQNLARAMFWAHPAVHWLNGQLSQAREEVCDNFVLAQCDPADYAETLLKIAERCPPRPLLIGGLAMLTQRGSLEGRIAGLLDASRDLSTRWPLWRRWGIQAVLLGVPLLLGLIRVTTYSVHGDETAPAARSVTGAALAAEEPAGGATASDGQQASGRITGQVVRDSDGAAVAGADVFLLPSVPSGDRANSRPPPTRQTKTDSKGKYAFDGLSAGRFRVWANFEKLTSRRETLRGSRVVIPETGEVTQSATLRVVPAGAITVRVIDKSSGQAVPNATVHFGSGDSRYGNVLTDASGKVTVGPLGAGQWQIETWADGFARARRSLNLEEGSDADLEFALVPGGDIEGTVRDSSGKPLAGVELWVSQEGDIQIFTFLYTDAEGRYRLGHLPIDSALHVNLWKADYRPGSFPARTRGPKQTRDFTLEPRSAGGTVAGKVVDDQGRPIAGAVLRNAGRSPNGWDDNDDVAPSSEVRESTTGDDGRFRLDNLYPQPGFGADLASVMVRAKEFVAQRLEVKPGSSDNPTEMQITLETGHRLLGRVADDDGRPLAGVAVSVGERNLDRYLRVGTTDAKGEFEFDSLPKEARVAFEKSGYVPLDNRKFLVDTGDVVAVAMTPTGVIVGKVTDSATGKPIRSFRVRVGSGPRSNDQASSPRRVPGYFVKGLEFLSAEGKFKLDDVVVGNSFVVTVESAGYLRQTSEPVKAARPAAAEVVEIKLDPVDPATLANYSGRLLDANRQPVSGAQLRLIAARDRKAAPGRRAFPYDWSVIRTGQLEFLEQHNVLRFVKATTDKEGRFEFTEIPRQAEVELVWWGEGIAPGRADHFDQRLADSKGQPIEIVLPRAARVTGRIDRQVFPEVRAVSVRREDGANNLGDVTELKPDQETFEIDGLGPGNYVLGLVGPPNPAGGVRRPARPIASRNITLEEGETIEVVFDQK